MTPLITGGWQFRTLNSGGTGQTSGAVPFRTALDSHTYKRINTYLKMASYFRANIESKGPDGDLKIP